MQPELNAEKLQYNFRVLSERWLSSCREREKERKRERERKVLDASVGVGVDGQHTAHNLFPLQRFQHLSMLVE